MNWLKKLENKLAQAYEKLPNLPTSVRRTIAENAWWIILIIALISSFVLLLVIPSAASTIDSGEQTYRTVYPLEPLSFTAQVVNALVTLILSAVAVVLLFFAVKPLQRLERFGWSLLFVEELIGLIAVLASFVITIQKFEIGNLFIGVLTTAIELYVLFQVRPEFTRAIGSPVKQGKVAAATKKPARRSPPKRAAKKS